LKAYQKAYLELRFESFFVALPNNFDTSNFNKYDADSNEEVLEVQSNAPTKLKGRNIT
jgi:hypothetical protein